MNTAELNIGQADLRKLLAAASGDVALLYLYLHSGNAPEQAAEELHLSEKRTACAMATLRQLGLWQQERRVIIPGERPAYTERDVMTAMDTDRDFRLIYDEVQRLLGKNLNTEEMKIILGFERYLGLSSDVIYMLVRYCKERAQRRNTPRNPSLRSIEKEAYAWAEQGIDTMEEAAAFIEKQTRCSSQIGHLKRALQIYDRDLTATEEKYARQWLEMGFDTDAVAIAYDRACVHTGNRNWSYMNRILIRWHEAGLHTAEEIRDRDQKPGVPKGASGHLGAAELENIQRLLKED